VLIESQRGRFLFKRRVHGRDDPGKVAFTHELQLHLAAQNFPLPHLLGTRDDNNSMLLYLGNIYEMFEFVEGGHYDGSLDATGQAGKVLGLFHKLLADFRPQRAAPTGGYHDAKAIRLAVRSTVSSLPAEAAATTDQLNETVDDLEQRYRHCAAEVNELGLAGWPVQIVHGDWHPGNMLFADRRVVAVIDYDAARLQQRIIDVANGTLQFSIIGGSKDPADWPDYLDESRFKRFLRGYESTNVLSVAELEALPHLMCEAVIAEAVLPIAATGSFGRLEGFPFLQMVRRKVGWMLDNRQRLVAELKD
jgi:homoserine kinase type II